MRIPNKNVRRDRDAGIEGLPLQLMIMVVVAGLGTAIILGWMGNIEAPNGIGAVYSDPAEMVLTDSDGDGVFSSSGMTLTISVVDRNGEAVSGATVVLDGCDLRTSQGKQVHGLTDGTGKVTFDGLSASQSGRTVGFITVSVVKNGMGTDGTLIIPVVSE